VRDALLEVARENSHVLHDPQPTVFLETFGDSAINLELVVWSKEMSYRPRRFRSDLNFAIARKLREAGIEIPYPQRDVNLRDRVVRVELASPEKAVGRAVPGGA
jgi:potassium-dependent mechanosensitive channel